MVLLHPDSKTSAIFDDLAGKVASGLSILAHRRAEAVNAPAKPT
jgi:hypothetical protein